MRLVPIILEGKKAFHKAQVDQGDEGTMLKLASGTYVQVGRPDCMYKDKRHEEVDAFVTGFDPADEKAGWIGLVGNLRMSCFTETGAKHEVAYPANLELADRIAATVCSKCDSALDVKTANVDGKRVVQDITCTGCGAHRPPPSLAKSWYGTVWEVRGQEYTSRVWRLKHAFLERRRVGADGKSPDECVINLKQIQARFERLQHAESL